MNTLLIEDSSRLSADEIPLDPIRFKQWIDRACVEWPVDLMAQSWHAWDGIARLNSEAFLLAFLENYKRWLALTEPQKELLMTEGQIRSLSRVHHRRRALAVVGRHN